MVCESMGQCTQGYNYFKFIIEMDQSNTTKTHTFNTSMKMMANCLMEKCFPTTKRR